MLLETFMGVVQRTGAGSKPRNSRVVSKSDRDHGNGYYGNRTLGLTPAGTICHSTRSLGLYPILIRDGHMVAAYLASLWRLETRLQPKVIFTSHILILMAQYLFHYHLNMLVVNI